MAEQRPRVLFLEFSGPRVEKAHDMPVLPVHLLDLRREAVRAGERAGDQQVQIRVDAVFLESRDQVIQTVECLGVKPSGWPVAASANARREWELVHMMKPDRVDAELGQARRDLVRVLFARKIGGVTE